MSLASGRSAKQPGSYNRPVDAVVIGGGIAGCTLAWELASRGVKTVVLEQAVIATESSGRNTGTLLSGPQTQVVEMLDACAAIYEELSQGAVPFEFSAIGHLLISEDEASFEAAGTVADRYRAAGVAMEKVTGAELARDHPRIGFKVAGGYHVGRAWTLEPMGATHAFSGTTSRPSRPSASIRCVAAMRGSAHRSSRLFATWFATPIWRAGSPAARCACCPVLARRG